MLHELSRAHLLQQHVPGRYRMHDLVRLYAAERAEEHPQRARQAALRLADHYLHTAHAADRMVWSNRPNRDQRTLDLPQSGVVPELLPDADRAMRWFTAESAVLMAAIDWAARNGFDTHAWLLAATIVDFLDRQGRWYDWVAAQHIAVAAAERLCDRSALAGAHRLLGSGYLKLGEYAETGLHSRRALDLFAGLGDHLGQAFTSRALGWLCERQGDVAAAFQHDLRALDLFRTVGHQSGIAATLNSVGWSHAGETPAAQTGWHSTLRLYEQLGHADMAVACQARHGLIVGQRKRQELGLRRTNATACRLAGSRRTTAAAGRRRHG